MVTTVKPDVAALTFSRGARNQLVARAGEFFVVAELNKRGAHAVSFAGNMPRIDLLACNNAQSRTIHLQVKTKRGGRTWHASLVGSEPTEAPGDPFDEMLYWVFVDLGDDKSSPRYWIVPEWWIRNSIYTTHQAYLARHGGHQPRNRRSQHHAIDEQRLQEWLGRWDILGIF
jgi:hypothetical protein